MPIESFLLAELLAALREYRTATIRGMKETGCALRGLPVVATVESSTRAPTSGEREKMREKILAAVAFENAMSRIFAKLGVLGRGKRGTDGLVLPASHVAMMVQLARTLDGLLVPDVLRGAANLYKKFYGGDSTRNIVKQLEALGYVHRAEVLKKAAGEPWRPKLTVSGEETVYHGGKVGQRPLLFTPLGRKTLSAGDLGPNFKLYRTAFNGLPEKDQKELGQILEEIVYRGGKAPETLNLAAVQAYANTGVAELMSLGSRNPNSMNSHLAAEIITINENRGQMPLEELEKNLGHSVVVSGHRERSQEFGLRYHVAGRSYVASLAGEGAEFAEALLANPKSIEKTALLEAFIGLGPEKAARIAELMTKLDDAIPERAIGDLTP